MKRPSHSAPNRRDRGAAAIEMVFATPLLIALIVAIFDFGMYYSRRIEVNGAARDAARTLAVRGTPTYPSGMTPSGVTTCPANNVTSNAQVTVSTTYTFSIPFVTLGTRTITSTARMRCGG